MTVVELAHCSWNPLAVAKLWALRVGARLVSRQVGHPREGGGVRSPLRLLADEVPVPHVDREGREPDEREQEVTPLGPPRSRVRPRLPLMGAGPSRRTMRGAQRALRRERAVIIGSRWSVGWARAA